MSMAASGTRWLAIADLIGSIIYIIDLWMGFQLGIIARWEGRVVIVQSELRRCVGWTLHICWLHSLSQRSGRLAAARRLVGV